MRYLLWVLLVGGTAWLLWHYRRRLAYALRIMAVIYPLLLIVSLFQNGLDQDRLFLLLAMVVVGLGVFIVNRLVSEEE